MTVVDILDVTLLVLTIKSPEQINWVNLQLLVFKW